jgi:hypothetical protein
VHVAAADLHHEQAVQTLEGHPAVHVKEIDGQHDRGLGAQELPPGRVGASLRGRGIRHALRTRRIVDALARWPSLRAPLTVILVGSTLERREDGPFPVEAPVGVRWRLSLATVVVTNLVLNLATAWTSQLLKLLICGWYGSAGWPGCGKMVSHRR